MANSYLYGISRRHWEHARGRGTIVSDVVEGQYYVVCSKHPEIYQPVIIVGINEDASTKLEEAFDNCSGCIDEAHAAAQWTNTRFPESAEL